jgi:tRNA threonylcarbamoyladenosine biosynthesis protein TsaE
LRFRCTGVDATRAAARALAVAIGSDGLTLGLIGPLGAGKTAFVKGLAEGLGIDPAGVSSPTFVIMNQYTAGDRRLAHVDLYRLESAQELDDTGFVDVLEPGTIVAVEWADRLPQALPADRLELHIDRVGLAGDESESRSLVASAKGMGSQSVLEAWENGLRGDSRVEMVLNP